MHKLITVAALSVVITLSTIAAGNQSYIGQPPVVQAAESNQERQQQLRDWENKVKMWQDQQARNGNATTPANELPKTGPAQLTAAITAFSTVTGSVHYGLTRLSRRRQA